MGKTRDTANLISDNNIFSDVSNDRVGIGNTTPTAKLQITGNTIISGIATVSGLGGVAYVAITSTSTNKTLVNREYCTVVSAGVTVTLPASPQSGWEVGVAVGNFTNTVVARNGSNIMALNEDFTMDLANMALQFVYVDSVQGWRYF